VAASFTTNGGGGRVGRHYPLAGAGSTIEEVRHRASRVADHRRAPEEGAVTTETAADIIELQFLEHEHRRVREGLAGLQEAIATAHSQTRVDAIDRVVRTLAWLRRDVLPHAAWEEAWLYPHLDSVAGTPWATRALRFEHEQLRELAKALEAEFMAAEARWSVEEAYRLVVAQTRLETMLSAHLAQEQWFLSPLLLQRNGHEQLDTEARR
jgi:hemerythrin-like domain-containing protein